MRRKNETLLVTRVVWLDDRQAFASLVELYQSDIRRFFLHQTMGNEMLSDDLAQETFIKLYLSIKQFRGLSSFSTYLYRIAYNVFQDHLRRTRPTENEIPEEIVTTDNDTRLDIAQAMHSLSPIERATVTLHYIDDYKVEDVSKILSLPAGTVKSHLSRARSKLANYLKKNGYE